MPEETEMWMMDEAEKTVVRRFRGTETRTPDRLAGLVSVQIHFGQALSGTPHRDTAAGAFHVGVTASGTRTLKFNGLSEEFVQDRGSFYWYTNTWMRACARTRLTILLNMLPSHSTRTIYTHLSFHVQRVIHNGGGASSHVSRHEERDREGDHCPSIPYAYP
jgi:hypothetical protein